MVVDEVQDISATQLRFLAAIETANTNALFFAGDLRQRIFQQAFSWKAVGVDIRGRARALNVNYRTYHQIRQQADYLLGPEVTDVDGNIEDRGNTVSVFNGPEPSIKSFKTKDEEIAFVTNWIKEQVSQGVIQHEIGIFVRSDNEVLRAVAAIDKTGMQHKVLNEKIGTMNGRIAISTMHLAKGLEFKSVIVMACDDEIIPSQQRINTVNDQSDLEEVYNTERHLLYVACTRARDYLLITSVEPASEFLADLKMSQPVK